MSPKARRRISLADEVRNFRYQHFVFENDLNGLLRVLDSQAPEAVVFYSSRILEALASDAVRRLGEVPNISVFSNLETLRQYDIYSPPISYWGHALRHLGNDVRHIRCRIEEDSAQLACSLLERWLTWFFCSYSLGPRALSLTEDGGSLELAHDGYVRRLLEECESSDFNPCELVPRIERDGALSRLPCPGLFCLVAETLLDRRERDLAKRVLDWAIGRFPANYRLVQLRGHLHGHRGELEEARKLLPNLRRQARKDMEAASILAGILKRMWWQDRSATKELSESCWLYRSGWQQSERTNVYFGTNAATTSLWTGDRTSSKQLAEEVSLCLRRRESRLVRLMPERDPVANYWAVVSLAEAEVLLGRYDSARKRYREVFAKHSKRKQNIEGTKTQLGAILEVVLGSSNVEEFLDFTASGGEHV